MLSAKLPQMVKGAGLLKGKRLLDDSEALEPAFAAEKALRKAVREGIQDPGKLLKGLNPQFASEFAMFGAGLQGVGNPYGSGMAQLVGQLNQVLSAELGKDISLTSPLTSGLVPFDLLAPSRLIYPVYSPIRNKVPRVQGMGSSRRAKLIVGISGSQTGGAAGNVIDLAISEFPGGVAPPNWPGQLPASGQQAAVDLNVPYRFWGRSEALSWLAQFSGQGFEDISALANLILLQEFMLGEEYADIAATSSNVTGPASPATGGTARAAGTGEDPITGAGGSTIYIRLTAANFYGETASSTALTVAGVTNGTSVVDFSTPAAGLPAGALFWNVYVGTGAADPGAAASWFYGRVAGAKLTIQGALPTTGAAPTADTGTGKAERQEGIIPTLDGHSAAAGIYPSVGAGAPVDWQAGYVQVVPSGTTLTNDLVAAALQQVWDGPGAYRANPSELLVEGGDAKRLADSILAANAAQAAYRLFIDQGEVASIRAGAAVSEVQNPITRDVVRLTVHPWWTQGTVVGLSYTLPVAYSNVSNVWEKTLVQDYLSISWPVIDATFRYSMFMYGSMTCYAPQYNFIVKGISASADAPFS
jgi:hypothetical protein